MVSESNRHEAWNLSDKELEALRYIRNQVAHSGTFPSSRDIMKALGYKSPRSATLLLQRLYEIEIINREANDGYRLKNDPFESSDRTHVVEVPIVGQVAAGTPILAEENIETTVSVDEKLIKPGHKYFLLRVKGDSMNKAGIDDGDLVLVRSQQTADNGQNVVALIGDEATVKELNKTPSAVVLLPHSTNPANKPIVLTTDFQIQGIVERTIKAHAI